MLNHAFLGTNDVEKSRSFYDKNKEAAAWVCSTRPPSIYSSWAGP